MSNEHHITAEMTARYRAKMLGPGDLVAVTRHLAACPQCRRAAVRGPEEARLVSALGPEHLTFEQLEHLVRNPAAGNAEFVEHVTFCGTCAAELADLRAFRATLGLTSQPGRRQPARRLVIPAVAFAVMAIAFAGLELARKPVSPAAPAKPTLVASVRDLGGLVGLDSGGQVLGLTGLDTVARGAVAEALRSGTLPPQPDLRDVTRGRETQLSGEPSRPGPGAKSLIPRGPVGTVVSSDRPLFRWEAPAGAGSFRVAVFDADFNPITDSGNVEGWEWRPVKPLRRDTTYIWTVTATVGGVQVTAPKSPEPEARFRVANETEAAVVQQWTGKSDLALALEAWKLGMREEAQASVARLREANPESKELRRIEAGMLPVR